MVADVSIGRLHRWVSPVAVANTAESVGERARVRSILHEIRNHLAVGVANVEAFRDGVLEPSPARLDAVLQALREAEVLLDELPAGEAVPRAPREPRTVDICGLIAGEVLALEASARERKIDFTVDRCTQPDRGCLAFAADPLRIAEIVNNVITNAIRYTGIGGRVEVNCHRIDGALEFTVTDDGPGVEPAERSRIFDHGYRGSAAANEHSGSGTGLALTKAFVEEHGGSIEVLDAPGRGARFTVRLPDTSTAQGSRRIGDGTISLL